MTCQYGARYADSRYTCWRICSSILPDNPRPSADQVASCAASRSPSPHMALLARHCVHQCPMTAFTCDAWYTSTRAGAKERDQCRGDGRGCQLHCPSALFEVNALSLAAIGMCAEAMTPGGTSSPNCSGVGRPYRSRSRGHRRGVVRLEVDADDPTRKYRYFAGIASLSGSKSLRTFLEFFGDRGHQMVPGSSLVAPHGDPVLFTTAGMHPLGHRPGSAARHSVRW